MAGVAGKKNHHWSMLHIGVKLSPGQLQFLHPKTAHVIPMLTAIATIY